jgi:putative SOS response-associated peptidase YedK
VHPGDFAPVVRYDANGNLTAEWMRYSAFLPAHISPEARLTTYNARRDNLTSAFWQGAFGAGHGLILIDRFYEWVLVHDLLRSGGCKPEDVQSYFEKQTQLRQEKLLAQGKRPTLTTAEKKPLEERKIIVTFAPRNPAGFVVPVIFNRGKLHTSSRLYDAGGFAIVTDEPPEEVLAAGHDRCPVPLESSVSLKWLHPKGKTPRELKQLLGEREAEHFRVGLPPH